MPRIHFIAIRADRLAAWVACVIVACCLAGYLTFLGSGSRQASIVPRAILRRSLPATAEQPAPVPVASIGAPAPDFTLTDIAGQQISLSGYRGRPVLLYFWATWCTFCRDDMPALEEVYQGHRDDGLVILAVDLLEKAGAVAGFASQLQLSYPLVMDSDGAVSAGYSVRATPTYIFIDRDGVVRSQIVGRPRPAVFERNLELILRATEPPVAPSQ